MSYDPNSFDTDSYDPDSYDFGTLGEGPDPFSFQDANNVPLSTLITSEQIQITGLSATADISVSGGTAEYSINGGAWTNLAGTIENDDLLRVRVDSSASNSTAVDVTILINEVQDIWSVTTLAAPASGWNRGIVGNEIGFSYEIVGLGVVGTLGISTHE